MSTPQTQERKLWLVRAWEPTNIRKNFKFGMRRKTRKSGFLKVKATLKKKRSVINRIKKNE